jgi:hypothetical protein
MVDLEDAHLTGQRGAAGERVKARTQDDVGRSRSRRRGRACPRCSGSGRSPAPGHRKVPGGCRAPGESRRTRRRARRAWPRPGYRRRSADHRRRSDERRARPLPSGRSGWAVRLLSHEQVKANFEHNIIKKKLLQRRAGNASAPNTRCWLPGPAVADERRARPPDATRYRPDYSAAPPTGAGPAGGSRPAPGANHIETAVGWNASVITPTRSFRTASRSTVCRSRPLNAATTASAS